MKYLRDRYDLSDIQFTRREPGSERNRALMGVVDRIVPGGSVFHVFADTPDQYEDLLVILVDDTKMVRFELERDHAYPAVGEGPPLNVHVKTFDQARREAGQEFRKYLDRAAADVRRLLA